MKALAVVTPNVGVVSESFINRHIIDLHPGYTCVVAEKARGNISLLRNKLPLLLLNEGDEIKPNYLKKGKQKLLQKIGIVPDDFNTQKIKKFLQQHQVEVILAEYLDYSIRFIEVVKELGIRFYAHAHGYDVSIKLQDEHWRKKYLGLNDIDGIITVSNYSRKELIAIGINASKITVIPCGVSIPPSADVMINANSNISLVAIGRMVSKKAPILLLDAFRRALSEMPNLHLTYVGDGPLYAAAWQYVQTFNLEEKVALRGALPNEQVLSLLAAADIFIQHSITCPLTGDQEGLPVAILEALSYGVPVITTRHTGIPEAVKDGVNGRLVDELDTTGMAQAITQLARDSTLRKAMSKAARATAEANFSWELEREKLRALLKLD